MVNLSPDALSRGVNRLWTPKTLFESRPHIRVKYEPHTPTDHGFRIHGVQSDPEMYVSSPTGDPSHISPSIHAPSRDSYANIHHFGGYSSGLDVGYNSVAGMEGLGTRPPNRLDETANAFSDFSEDFTSTRDGYSSEDSTLDPVAYSGETSGTPPNPSINGSLNTPLTPTSPLHPRQLHSSMALRPLHPRILSTLGGREHSRRTWTDIIWHRGNIGGCLVVHPVEQPWLSGVSPAPPGRSPTQGPLG